MVNRLGRLTRVSDAQMEFSFEADGKTMQDPPMIILPNLNLMSMENAHDDDESRFEVSGDGGGDGIQGAELFADSESCAGE